MGKTAFLFAGQGSQFVGMGAGLLEGNDEIHQIIKNGPVDELNKTVNAQQAVFLLGLAEAKALRDKGITADCAAGLSLGEITALFYAEAIKDIGLVKYRAEAMQECCEKTDGTMVAVMRLTPDRVKELCAQFNEVWAVNFNGPEQVVCSCSVKVADDFVAGVTKAGGRAIKLKVSGAFHSPYMSDARDKVAELLKGIEIGTPNIPVYSNMEAVPYRGDYRALISGQITSPVLLSHTIENMLTDGVDTFIECGSGNVLCGLVKKIVETKGLSHVKIHKAEELL